MIVPTGWNNYSDAIYDLDDDQLARLESAPAWRWMSVEEVRRSTSWVTADGQRFCPDVLAAADLTDLGDLVAQGLDIYDSWQVLGLADENSDLPLSDGLFDVEDLTGADLRAVTLAIIDPAGDPGEVDFARAEYFQDPDMIRDLEEAKELLEEIGINPSSAEYFFLPIPSTFHAIDRVLEKARSTVQCLFDRASEDAIEEAVKAEKYADYCDGIQRPAEEHRRIATIAAEEAVQDVEDRWQPIIDRLERHRDAVERLREKVMKGTDR